MYFGELPYTKIGLTHLNFNLRNEVEEFNRNRAINSSDPRLVIRDPLTRLYLVYDGNKRAAAGIYQQEGVFIFLVQRTCAIEEIPGYDKKQNPMDDLRDFNAVMRSLREKHKGVKKTIKTVHPELSDILNYK